MDNKKAFEVLMLVTHKGVSKKLIKKYLVISGSIPKNKQDLNAGENEEFIESRYLPNYTVVVK